MEVLLAAATALLVLGLAYGLFHLSTLASLRRGKIVEGRLAAATALEDLAAEMVCGVNVERQGELRSFELEGGGNSGTDECRVSFCFLAAQEGKKTKDPWEDLRWSEIVCKRYRLEPAAGGRWNLVCEQQPYWGDGGVSTGIVLRGVRDFRVRVLQRGEWLSHWPPAGSADGWPQAVRLRLESGEGESLTTQVFIPVANEVGGGDERKDVPADGRGPKS